jgi:hypothetical protein
MTPKQWLSVFKQHPQKEGENTREYCRRISTILPSIGASATAGAVVNMYYKTIAIEKNAVRDLKQYKTSKISTNKKELKELNWRQVLKPLEELRETFKESKGHQTEAIWKVKTDKPIVVLFLADLHMGSWATDHTILEQLTDEILAIDNLYVMLGGDLLQMAIKLRGVAEVSDNALPPYWQLKFLESWLMEIQHKVICSTWDNHSVMREEAQVGFSTYSEIFKRMTIYHEGIGHIDLHVNNQVYKVALSHFFRGRSMLNPVHGQMRYIRMEAPDRDICLAGDSHVPGMLVYPEGGKTKYAINSGSLQNSGYGQRFFSIKHLPKFPCFVLDHEEHLVTPYWSLKHYLKASGQIEGNTPMVLSDSL